MRVRLTSAVFDELHEATEWYDGKREKLGRRFLRRVVQALKRIRDEPHRHAVYEGCALKHECRRFRVQEFPYLIIYRIEGKEVEVVAISHASRKPGYWEKR